ncbi:hypothetical protein V5799_011602 [Amblyomma americanum]|uniref:Uncharacterized protein n=1 Tax=Amblyomma americanum TaxID=6943 RepID=A0AAQ4EGD7_AMBAM
MPKDQLLRLQALEAAERRMKIWTIPLQTPNNRGAFLRRFIERVSDRNLHTAVPAQNQSAVQKAAQFYQSCSLVYTTGGERELSTVRRLLADFGVFWPRLSNASNLLRICFAMSAVLDWAPVILFSLARPGHIVVTPAPFYAFLLGRRRAMLSSSNDGREYKSYFSHMVDTFRRQEPSSDVLSYYELLAMESQIVPALQQAYTAADGGIIKNGTLDDILNLAGEAIPRSKWDDELGKNFKSAIPNDTTALRFVIENVFFFAEFFALMDNLSESQLAYYVGWTAVQGLSLFTKPAVINFYYPSRSQALQGHVMACGALSHHYMGLAFYANYIREEFSAHELADVIALVNHVRKFFREGFSSSGALKEFIDKSQQSLDQNAPFPSAASAPLSFVTDSQEGQLNELFRHFPDQKPSIFDNIQSVAVARRMTRADTRAANFRWNGKVRLYYLTDDKRFELLPTALEPPFYSAEAPPAVKYGALGAEIGDAMAALVSMWLRDADENTRAKVYTEALCRHNRPVIPVETATTQVPSWPNISRRELAERVVSLNAAFRAFLDATDGGNQYRLDGYESLTGKRMFFIIWCMAQCGASYGKQKCHDPLRLFRYFARAFECKVGSVMSTIRECT